MPQVKIRIESGTETAGDGQELQENKQKVSLEKVAVMSVFATQMISTAKQSLNFAVSNIGVNTGDYTKSVRIQKTLSAIGDITSVASGFAAGGWVGGTIAIAGITTNKIFEAISIQQDLVHDNIRTEYLKTRSGNTTKNGSRGTEN